LLLRRRTLYLKSDQRNLGLKLFEDRALREGARDNSGGTMSDGFWQVPVDFFSLILILVAGIELGLIGFFGFSVLTWLFGRWHFVAYDVIGVSAVWQILRQRFFG
jgi:uncharacterized membrane protein YuzA (DUF378 family)